MATLKRKEMVNLLAPCALVEAVDKVASRKFKSRSEYIRQAVLEALAKDGVMPLAA